MAKAAQYSFGRVPCVIFHYQLCSRYIFCFFFRVNKKEVCFLVTFFAQAKKVRKRFISVYFLCESGLSVNLSIAEYIVHFLFRNKKRTKEMRPLKRRGRLAAHKVPNFIRYTVYELIGLPIKGKT